MNEKEILANHIAENVDGTATEQIVEQNPSAKTYTEEEFNKKLDEVLGKKIARKEAKIRKEYDRKYGELESVLRAGTGKNDVTEMTDTFKKFYEGKGIKMPSASAYSDRDIEVLAGKDAEDIISGGFEEVVEEVDRLSAIGVQNMSSREKALFKTLAEYRQNTERGQELAKIGVTEDVYNSQAFKDFSSKFSPKTPVAEIYEIYNKMHPRKEVHTIGSMKSSTANDGVKDFYSYEEASKFTTKDFDKNPALFKAVQNSMTKW